MPVEPHPAGELLRTLRTRREWPDAARDGNEHAQELANLLQGGLPNEPARRTKVAVFLLGPGTLNLGTNGHRTELKHADQGSVQLDPFLALASIFQRPQCESWDCPIFGVSGGCHLDRRVVSR